MLCMIVADLCFREHEFWQLLGICVRTKGLTSSKEPLTLYTACDEQNAVLLRQLAVPNVEVLQFFFLEY
jgi:hypothetical protein